MNKLELALVELARAKIAEEAISKQIGEAIGLSSAQMTDEQCRRYEGKNMWLKLAYEKTWVGIYEGYHYENHEDDVEGYLAENCPHALRAHQLIQERKPLRKALGVAKRRVSLLATNLMKKADHAS